MTLKEACEIASREVGMSEEDIVKANLFTDLYLPGKGNELIPPGGERLAVERIKDVFQNLERMTEAQQRERAAWLDERLRQRLPRN